MYAYKNIKYTNKRLSLLRGMGWGKYPIESMETQNSCSFQRKRATKITQFGGDVITIFSFIVLLLALAMDPSSSDDSEIILRIYINTLRLAVCESTGFIICTTVTAKCCV